MHTNAHIGRFAPTPSGVMHAGNILCALISYLSVKSRGGKYLVRIEDLDAPRCPKTSSQKILDTLNTLGLGGDETPVWQSTRQTAYQTAERILESRANVYPCFCTRAELHAAEAPRLVDGGIIYSGACKSLTEDQRNELQKSRKPCIRIEVPDETFKFVDGIMGAYSTNLKTECGDFILKRSDGVYAYQLAVVVDDGEFGVTEVVRGADLISSAPRQMFLQRLLGLPTPRYYHIPLVCDYDGRKLSKSDGDSAERLLRKFDPEYILGHLAYAAGILNSPRSASLAELTAVFDFKNIKTTTIYLPKELNIN